MSTKFLKIEFDNLVIFLKNNPSYTKPSHWVEILERGSEIESGCIVEIFDNLSRGTPSECLVYLKELKLTLLRLFEPESLKATSENNLLAYFLQQKDFDEIHDVNERENLSKAFAFTIPLQSLDDIKLNKKEFLKKNLRKRSIGVLPYVGSHPIETDVFIKKVQDSTFADMFHEFLHLDISFEVIEEVELRELLLNGAKIALNTRKTDLLRKITGYVISLLKDLSLLTYDVDQYFKDPADIQNIMLILRKNGVISPSNKWQEIILEDENRIHGTCNAQSSLFALIDVLVEKGYVLKPKRNTTIRRAFSNTFQIRLKDRSLRKVSNHHDQLLDYFHSIIPPR